MASTINASTSAGLVNTADTSGVLQLQTANTTALTVDTSANVGIGTTSPAAKLDVNVSSGVNLQLTKTTGAALTFSDGAIRAALQGLNGSDGLGFTTGSSLTERMRIDSSGNVGIGVVPSTWFASANVLQMGKASAVYANTGVNQVKLLNNVRFDASGNPLYLSTGTAQDYTVDASGNFIWSSAISGSAGGAVTLIERMRIDSSGNLLVGTTSSVGSGINQIVSSTTSYRNLIVSNASNTSGAGVLNTLLQSNANNTVSYHLVCNTGGTDKFYIYGNGTYGTVSDKNLKKNIETARDGYLNDLVKLRVVKYNWETDSDNTPKELGWIAQEVAEVFSGLVQDGIKQDDGSVYKQVKTSVLPFMLLKAIQELKAINDTQAETINALTARLVALESK